MIPTTIALMSLRTTADATSDMAPAATQLEKYARWWGLPPDHFKAGVFESAPLGVVDSLLVLLVLSVGLGLAYFLLMRFARAHRSSDEAD